MTVEELLYRVSSRELTEWMLFYEIEPFGTEVEMYGHAMTASTLLNIYRDVDKHPKPIMPKDVMPKWGSFDKVESQIAKVEEINKLLGGKDKRNVSDSR